MTAYCFILASLSRTVKSRQLYYNKFYIVIQSFNKLRYFPVFRNCIIFASHYKKKLLFLKNF